jgi:8-oxo-dGTP diphosphatase
MKASAQQRVPAVGVGVIVIRDKSILLGQRIGSHGAQTWAPPGGHLEYGESVEHCAAREVLEETGLELLDIRRGPYTSDVFEREHKHYITLFVVARVAPGEALAREPEKCRSWEWFSWTQLPGPLFASLATLHRSGFSPQDA